MAKIEHHPTSLLLVEGNDDFHVVHSICKIFGVDVRNLENPKGGNFSVIDCKGIDELFEQIPIRFKSSQTISKIAVIIDADSNLKSRWQTLENIFNEIGFDTPKEFPNNGLILSKEGKTIGVWIMPNNDLNGMLEDFIAFLVPKDDVVLPIVEKTLNDLENEGINKYSIIHKSKAKIHTWLSLQEEPGTPLGQGITKRYLTTDDDNCKLFVNWLNNLFS